MFFGIRAEAARILQQYRALLTAAAFADRAASFLPLAGTSAAFVFVYREAGMYAAMIFSAAALILFTFCSALIRSAAAKTIGSVTGADLSQGKNALIRTVFFLGFYIRTICKKTGWFLLFALPISVPFLALILLSRDRLLYSACGMIAALSALLLFLLGFCNYFAVTSVCGIDRFLSANGVSKPLRRGILRNADRIKYFFFLISLLGWQIASFLPLVSLFSVPYIATQKAVYHRMFCGDEDIRIYPADQVRLPIQTMID